MTRGRPEYRRLDHTADEAILVRAPGERELFERAAAAMFDLVADLDAAAARLDAAPDPAAATLVEVDSIDREALLVAFLGELLSLALLEGRVFAAFEVTALAPWRIGARCWSVPAAELGEHLRTELKAVTYHELLVAEDDDGWTARVVFDV